MDIKQITYFVEVANHKSYSLAANKLGITQPALSAAIKKLEQEFNVKLFSYNNKQLVLTEMGKEFLNNTRKLLQDYEALVIGMNDIVSSNIGKIKIGVPVVVSSVYFSSLFSTFKKKYPKIEFSIIEEGSLKLASMVEMGDIDCALVVEPIDLVKFDVHEELKSHYVIAMSKENPLSEKDEISFEKLRNEIFACFNNQYAVNKCLMDNCEKCGFTPNVIAYSSQWDFMMSLVLSNQAICMLPKPLVERYENKKVKLMEIVGGSNNWNVCLITKKGQYLSRSTRLFIDHVKRSSKND